MVARGIMLRCEAVRYGCRQVGQVSAKQLRRRRLGPGGPWHLEECPLSLHVPPHRDERHCITNMVSRAVEIAGETPWL
jgi:hypothetical protein